MSYFECDNFKIKQLETSSAAFLKQCIAIKPVLLMEHTVDVILLCGLHFTLLSTVHCWREKQNGRKTESQIRKQKMKEKEKKRSDTESEREKRRR